MSKCKATLKSARLLIPAMTKPLFLFLAFAVSVAARADSRIVREFNVNGGNFYELEVSGLLGSADAAKEQAIGAAYVEFSSRYRRLKARSSYISGVLPNDPYRVYECFFPDTAVFNCGTNHWRFQFRAPEAADKVSVEVKPWRNFSNVDFLGVKLSAACPVRHQLALGRVEKTLQPGPLDNEIMITGRTSLPTSLRVSLYNANGERPIFATNVLSSATNGFRLAFPLPSLASRKVIVKVKMKNGERDKAELWDLKTISRFKPIALPSKNKPVWLKVPVMQADSISISGNLVASDTSDRTAKSGLMRISFTDDDDEFLRVENMAWSKENGNFAYLHSGNTTTNGNFKVNISIPESARTLYLGFSKWAIPNTQMLAGLKVDFSHARFALPDYITSLKQQGIDSKSVNRFLIEQLGTNYIDLLKLRNEFPQYKASQFQGPLLRRDKFSSSGVFRLIGCPDFDVSTKIDWAANPFNNSMWLLKYDSGFWIPFAAPENEIERRYAYCRDAWFGFWSLNAFYPSAANSMVFTDQVLAARIKAILVLMFGLEDDISMGKAIPPLWDHIVADEDFLSMLMYQLCVDAGIAEGNLQAKQMGIHVYNLIMAKALLLFADAFPMLETSARYKQVAVDSIFRHVNALYGQDGFVREQSAAFHHAYIQYFLDFHQYFRDNNTVEPARIRKLERFLAKILRVDAQVCFPDGVRFVPIGDLASGNQRQELRQYVGKFKTVAKLSEKVPVEFKDMAQVTVLKQSGLYVFRNTAKGKMLIIDISPNKVAHGHYDCGSYHYFSDGVRWLADRGGPYKYASRLCREMMSSASHSVACPADANQMVGIAYNVDFKKTEEGWSLSFWTNVYGSKYRHKREFVIGRDVSKFSVEDTFYGPKAAGYVNRMVLGQGVKARIVEAARYEAVLRSGASTLHIQSSHSMHKRGSTASYAPGALSQIKVLEADGLSNENGEMRFSYKVEASANTTQIILR